MTPENLTKSLVVPPSDFEITERSLDMATMTTNKASFLADSAAQDLPNTSEFSFLPVVGGSTPVGFTPTTDGNFVDFQGEIRNTLVSFAASATRKSNTTKPEADKKPLFIVARM